MNRNLIIRPEAEADISEAAIWYEDREPGLAHELLFEIRTAINRALTNPEAFTRLRERPRVHRVLVRRFPYRLFYILNQDTLIVFAVLHLVRHDRHWLRRI